MDREAHARDLVEKRAQKSLTEVQSRRVLVIGESFSYILDPNLYLLNWLRDVLGVCDFSFHIVYNMYIFKSFNFNIGSISVLFFSTF